MRASQFAAAAAFFVIFFSSVGATMRALLDVDDDAGSWVYALALTALLVLAVVASAAERVHAERAHAPRASQGTRNAALYTQWALAAAVSGVVLFVLAAARLLTRQEAAATYGTLVGPALCMYVASWLAYHPVPRALASVELAHAQDSSYAARTNA